MDALARERHLLTHVYRSGSMIDAKGQKRHVRICAHTAENGSAGEYNIVDCARPTPCNARHRQMHNKSLIHRKKINYNVGKDARLFGGDFTPRCFPFSVAQ